MPNRNYGKWPPGLSPTWGCPEDPGSELPGGERGDVTSRMAHATWCSVPSSSCHPPQRSERHLISKTQKLFASMEFLCALLLPGKDLVSPTQSGKMSHFGDWSPLPCPPSGVWFPTWRGSVQAFKGLNKCHLPSELSGACPSQPPQDSSMVSALLLVPVGQPAGHGFGALQTRTPQ